ncbi:beta-1,4-galactosyltransferase galt-1-like [Leptodactylus fuscus]|uniref:beta-1,4-galactosyltransferase galt-1-like n=1 Tax=Leptodactylus fuscus TaxID=238119 RepID=UPI003F4E9078
MCSLKQLFLLACVLGLGFISYIYGLYGYNVLLQHTVQQRFLCIWRNDTSDLAQDTITPLKGNQTFIIAPYYDNREENLVRVLGIVHHTEVKKLCCYLYCEGQKDLYSVQASIDIHEDHFGFPFGLADIKCYQPPQCQASHLYFGDPSDTGVTSMPKFDIRNRERGQFSANFTVCISTVYGNYSNALQFIQTIEMYKLLGAQRVTIYVKDCSQLVEGILDYYSKEGTVEVVPWPIQNYLNLSRKWRHDNNNDGDIGYYGQLSTLIDCLYKNMYKSKYVILNDLDEIILPFEHMTWDSMMEKLQRENPGVGIFFFESHNFPQRDPNETFDIQSWKEFPGFNLLKFVRREPDIFNARKMIVNPREVFQISVHTVLKTTTAKTLDVPLKTALVHHCREPYQPNLKTSQLIDDPTIWKYNVSLVRNVNQVLEQISLRWKK